MHEKAARALSRGWTLLMASALSPASAQGLCSGRCFVHPITGGAYCGLSLFGVYICHEGIDYCVEFECPGLMASTPEDMTAWEVHAARSGQCRQASSAPPDQTLLPSGKIQVATLKART